MLVDKAQLLSLTASEMTVLVGGMRALGISADGIGDSCDNCDNRSEERRVGKECRSRWSPYH